jgi:cobalt/nickel transport system ATP-binding protein
MHSPAPSLALSSRVEVQSLTYHYSDGRTAVRDVTLAVEPGECLGIVGASGAGKSTFLLHLNGILLPNSGSVRIGGITVSKQTLRDIRSRVGIVFQNPDDQLFTPTVEEDVAFGPRNLGCDEADVRTRVAAALGHLRLQGFEKRSTQDLSFGEKRRVALATVLAMRPQVIGFDEPFANNDPAMVENLIDIINGLSATVILVSQDILPALACADRLAVFHAGTLAAIGPAPDIARDRDLLRRCGADFHFYGRIWEELFNS